VEGGASSVGAPADEDVFEKQMQEWMKEEPTCDDKGNFTDDDDSNCCLLLTDKTRGK